MPHWTDVIIDIETTGNGPDLNAIIQIGAVQFNIETREVNPDFFNRCLLIPPRRFWDEGTREWWCRMPDLLGSIYDRMEDPARVMDDFYGWLGGAYCGMSAYSKPLSFDIPFVESYFKDLGRPNPLPFWKGRDIRSLIAGLNWGVPDSDKFDEKSIPFQGTVHDALDDALHELRLVFAATDRRATQSAKPHLMEPHQCTPSTLQAPASGALETLI